MTSRAERKRRRKTSITLAGGQQIEQPKRQGRRTDMEQLRSARETALSARVRLFGGTDSQEGRNAVSGPEFGCDVGRAIMAEHISAEDKADLWQAVCHMRRTWTAYDRAMGAPSRHAQCLAILAPTEAMTADATSPAPDFRSQEDRDRQAIAAYMTLRGWLGHCDGAAQSAAIIWVVDMPDAPFSGYDAIKRALLCVVDGIKGRQVKTRIATTS